MLVLYLIMFKSYNMDYAHLQILFFMSVAFYIIFASTADIIFCYA